ncbi:MAG TPA: type IV toxin-antitoxin system AbiEi family antitoxin domain-containing protein [Polyangia bacterium]|jgi:predicted transcriptional regulator of viral defense system
MPRRSTHGPRPVQSKLYEVAAAQAGYFTAREAAEAGYSLPLLHHHVDAGRFERAARGIFRLVQYPPSDHEDLVVLWLWSSRHGVFSHETALTLHGLSDALPANRHLSLPASWSRRRLRVPAATTLHYADLSTDEIAWSGPIPVTSVVRTIVDCAVARADPRMVSQARHQATRRGLCHREELEAALRAAGVARRRSR